jgi:uncharacterized protein
LSAHLERVDGESVHLRGHLSADLDLECNRCLEPFTLAVEEELDLFYLPHQAEAEGDEEEDEVELQDREMVVAYHDGVRVDIGEIVREQLILAVPLKRLCREDCRGRCLSCGKDLNGPPCGCPPPRAEADPRLAALKKLFPKGSD